MDVFENNVLMALAKLVSSEVNNQSKKENDGVKRRSGRYPWGLVDDEMLVLKKCKMVAKFSDIKIGDQIEVELNNLGTFTATAHDITAKGVLFIFDDCVVRCQMNEKCNNDGGYEKSYLHKWINTTLIDAFPEDIRKRITEITIPTYGQMIGHDDWYKNNFESDNDEQLSLMKTRKNRIATYENDTCWYWLRNTTKKSVSSEDFAVVDGFGCAAYCGARGALGVRPAFLLVN